MRLMKNKYLKFDDIIVGDWQVKNVTTLNLLPDIPEKYFTDEYILYKRMEDDRLLEAVSFDLYKDTNYWDILLMLNEMSSMNELPVNYDIILIRVDRKIEEWREKGKLMYSNLNAQQIADKYEELLALEIELNEKHRNLKYISPSDLSSLMADISALEGKIKIDKDLIISKD